MSANLDLCARSMRIGHEATTAERGCAHPAIEYVIADGPSPSIQHGVPAMAQLGQTY